MEQDIVNRANYVNDSVQLRSLPFPFRAMLAICSDLDSTLDGHVYLEIMRFLNTTGMTAMGQGVGLEVGNSIHFCAIPPQCSYWDTDDAGREMVQTLIRSGHIDCLHSFGELVYTREEAKQALDELTRHGCHLEVWVDHGGAKTNFGPDIMAGHGDEIDHSAYHADLTIDYGIKYAWRGRTTSITGQDSSGGLAGVFNKHHPLVSSQTLCKEAAKQVLGRIGSERYAMHGPNKLLRRSVLRDGQRIYEFMRCNPHWGGVGSCDEGRSIGEVLTSDMLDLLVDRGGTCILYTHLGKVDDPHVPFNEKAQMGFRRLADQFRKGKILVTTTRRLLGYKRAVREVAYTCHQEENGLGIDISTKMSENWVGKLTAVDLAGLTFYVPDPQRVSIAIDGKRIENLRRNASDYTGRPSVSIPWPKLEFPEI